MEQIDQETKEPLEGVAETPQQRQRTFKTLSALLDYVQVFKIESFRCDSGVMYGTNEKVYRLSYMNMED